MTLGLEKTEADSEYVSEEKWSHDRPHTLVICCSDGRLQTSIDDFLQTHLNVTYYDRLYAPGGPAALADGGAEFGRANIFRDQYRFLATAHQIEQVVLLFHGAAPDGPADSVCAHYRRLMPMYSSAQINARQTEDLRDVLSHVVSVGPKNVRVRAYRAEVRADHRVHFADLL